jgi:tRNA G10  N-methylase Trm11
VTPVTTVTFGTNEQLIADVASLYLADGDVVADVTYSTGRFWKKTDLSRYKFLASDLMPERPGVLASDFRTLPYRDGSVDAVIFDPPYIHSPGKGMLKDRYNGLQTTDMITYADIMALYKDGMTEAARVLRDGGQLWVKCKDTLASERQRWSHITIYELAQELGLYSRDLFLLVPPAPSSVTTGRWARQIHARKVHSYLWIFETGGYKRRG